jgi:hypothetical protein
MESLNLDYNEINFNIPVKKIEKNWRSSYNKLETELYQLQTFRIF